MCGMERAGLHAAPCEQPNSQGEGREAGTQPAPSRCGSAGHCLAYFPVRAGKHFFLCAKIVSRRQNSRRSLLSRLERREQKRRRRDTRRGEAGGRRGRGSGGPLQQPAAAEQLRAREMDGVRARQTRSERDSDRRVGGGDGPVGTPSHTGRRVRGRRE